MAQIDAQLHSTALALLLASAVLVSLVGISLRLRSWFRAPGHPRFALAPAPSTRAGVALRLLAEGLLFPSLWRASRLAWLLGWPFHAALAVIAVEHLRYLSPAWLPWVEQLAARGHLASALLLVCLAGLWLRRIVVPRIRYVSRPADHLWLALLLLLAASGVVLKYVAPVNVVAVKAFVQGILGARIEPLPHSAVLWLHLVLASLLIGLLPFSKLLHGAAVWVNPTRASRAPAAARRGSP